MAVLLCRIATLPALETFLKQDELPEKRQTKYHASYHPKYVPESVCGINYAKFKVMEDKIRILREADRGKKSIQNPCQMTHLSEVSFHQCDRCLAKKL